MNPSWFSLGKDSFTLTPVDQIFLAHVTETSNKAVTTVALRTDEKGAKIFHFYGLLVVLQQRASI